jgi:hypothetical protein
VHTRGALQETAYMSGSVSRGADGSPSVHLPLARSSTSIRVFELPAEPTAVHVAARGQQIAARAAPLAGFATRWAAHRAPFQCSTSGRAAALRPVSAQPAA